MSFLRAINQLPLIQRFRLNSIGTKLFISVVGGALVGVGGITFLFGEIVKYQAEAQIQQAVSDKVQLLDGRLEQAELFAESLRTSILALHLRNTNSAETYRQLLFELFKDRPSFVRGLGIGQSQNGILPQQQWFSAYYYLDSGEPDAAGTLLSPPYNDVRYVDGTQANSFYPESDRYRTFFVPQEDVWSSPALEEQHKTTYYAQILDDSAGWLGTVFVELDPTAFNDVIETPVTQGAGYTALLTRTGQVIANPSAANEADPVATYQSVPGLEPVWSEMTGQAGILEGEEGYWAYEQIPEREWIAVAFVPYEAVFDRVALITVGGTLAVGLALALVVALSVRSLNHRLRPMLAECHRIAGTDAEKTALEQQDEVEQISTAFFKALEQLKLDQEQIQQDLVNRVQTEEQLKQMAIAEQANQKLQTEVEQLLRMVAALESGDLTVEARSSTGVTGSIANTLNRLVERLGHVIAIVLGTTEYVAQGANQLEKSAVSVSNNAEQQTESIIQVQNLIETVDDLSQEAAQQITATSEAVRLTQSATLQGQQEITTISEGMSSLQQNTNQITKRVEMLTSYVELAAQFAKDQKRIASMTRILAVNASMLANRAAMQQDPQQFASITREFETVAAQVDDLASQTNQSLILLQQRTDQIQTTVSGLDYDVQEISQQVSDFTVGVDQSLQVFDTIQTASEQVDQTWQQMVQSSQAIATAVQTALQSIRTIAAIAVETSEQASLTKAQTQEIEQLAQMLLQTVDFFKLRPGTIPNSSHEPAFPTFHSQTRQNGHSALEEPHPSTVNVAVSQPDVGQLMN
ncbi:methyl-accepting chemotaxis protein [Cyanobacteria bacterium FACHB-471]|nr:methyl-accepting chemotaxis protein [Cyanobacteria bacterium FACHB-471]